MKTNKILAAILALTLTAGGVMPLGVTVNAASDTNEQLVDVARVIVASGTCGKNATWNIDSEGVLIISGTGEIKENAFYDNEAVKKVIIEDGITSIGRSVFHYCDNLESISIPDSVTYIDTNAFNLCRKLESITIPDSVTSMGTDVFQGCIGLKSVKLPSSITSINTRLFGRCHSLESVDIPDSVTSINMDAFEQCTGLETINIPDSVINIGSEAFTGTVWLDNKKKENPLVIVNGILIDGTSCSGNVIIPDTVKSIAGCAFMDCDGIKTVIIPASVTNIDHKAFQFCRDLNSVTIMNPDCTINGDQTTIYNVTISGYNGSTAEAYAREYNYQFESIGDYVPPKTTTTSTTTSTTTTTTNAASANYAHNYNYVAWDVWDEKPYSPDLIMLRPKENDYDDKVCVFSTIGCNSNSVTCTDVFFDREDYESDSFELRAVTWGYPNNYRIFADKKDQRNLGKIQYETIAVYENGMKKEIIGPRKADTVWNGTSYIYLHKNMTVYCNPDTKIYYYTSYNDYSDELQRVTCDKIGYFNSDGSITLLDNVIRLGDVNHDNIINMEDAAIIQNHINSVKPIDEKFLWAADVNGDKVVDIEDVTAVIDHINGGESFEKKHENENYLILSDEDNITTVTTSTTTNTTSTTTTNPQVTSSGNKTHEPTEKEWGDTNCDGNLELADAILIMQSLANPDKYTISEQGRLNGDVDKSTKGLTANDALMIQEHLLGKTK